MPNIEVATKVAGMILADHAAVPGGRISYGELAGLLELPPFPAPWSEHALRIVLKALDAEDRAAGRPLRSVVAVNKKKGKPGGGFFQSLGQALGTALRTPTQRKEAYEAERTKALAFYSAAPPDHPPRLSARRQAGVSARPAHSVLH